MPRAGPELAWGRSLTRYLQQRRGTRKHKNVVSHVPIHTTSELVEKYLSSSSKGLPQRSLSLLMLPRMAGKRARGPARDASDLPKGEKKIKIEQPDPKEENIFEAARRRREARIDPSKDSGGPAAPSSSRIKSEEANTPEHGAQSYEAWEKRWKDVYPSSIVGAVGAVRKRTQTGSNPSQTLPPSVYIVINRVDGRWVDSELDILGTYATAASANEHAMVYFSKEHPHAAGPGSEFWDEGIARDLGSFWEMDSNGCLSLASIEKNGDFKVFVSKQVIKDHPPEPKPASPVPPYADLFSTRFL